MRPLLAALVLLLSVGACRSDEEREAERAQAQLDSMARSRDARPVVPLEYDDVRIGTARDTLPLSGPSARP